MRNILFISHDATRTGAPILLLNLIGLLQKSGQYKVRVVVKNGEGDLLDQFSRLGDMLVWRQRKPTSVLQRLKDKLGVSREQVEHNKKAIQGWIDESEVVVSNTITNGDLLRAFNFNKPRLVACYVHELGIAAQFYTNPQDLNAVLAICRRFLSPSEAVADFLQTQFAVESNSIRKLAYFIPGGAKDVSVSTHGQNALVVGIAGTLDWRKGADVLTIIVSRFFRKYPSSDVVFRWKGASLESVEYRRIMYELEKVGLLSRVELEASSGNMDAFYHSIDVLLLCSKEDPYPLVVLEAAAASKPIICFQSAGGAPEFVGNDAGDSIAYLDIESMVDALYQHLIDRASSRAKGATAFKRYVELHQSQGNILRQFAKAIEN